MELIFHHDIYGEFRAERTGDDEWTVYHNGFEIAPYYGTPSTAACVSLLIAYRRGRESGHRLGRAVGRAA